MGSLILFLEFYSARLQQKQIIKAWLLCRSVFLAFHKNCRNCVHKQIDLSFPKTMPLRKGLRIFKIIKYNLSNITSMFSLTPSTLFSSPFNGTRIFSIFFPHSRPDFSIYLPAWRLSFFIKTLITHAISQWFFTTEIRVVPVSRYRRLNTCRQTFKIGSFDWQKSKNNPKRDFTRTWYSPYLK